MDKQEIKLNPAEECSYFDSCNVNLCPLDRNFNKLTFSPLDKEINCILRKSVRRKIARKYGLPIITIRKRKSLEFKGNKNDKVASNSQNSGELSK